MKMLEVRDKDNNLEFFAPVSSVDYVTKGENSGCKIATRNGHLTVLPNVTIECIHRLMNEGE